MSYSINSQDQSLTNQPFDHHNPNPYDHEAQQWEVMARDWLSTLPEGKSLSLSDVEAWLQSNHASLPDQIKSMPLPELYQQFTSIHTSIEPHNEEYSQARFQRTDQWKPVYIWLESIEADEVVKSKDILDWLSENPEVKDDLYSRHSRYHLMHYIKKCHVKILKRKEKKKKGLQITDKADTPKVHKPEGRKLPISPLPCSTVKNIPADSDMYLVKRNEALRKYEILVELEKQLSSLFPKPENMKFLEDS